MTTLSLFDLEASLYILGWFVGRVQMRVHGVAVAEWYRDWNFWGNLLFAFGSFGDHFTDWSYVSSMQTRFNPMDCIYSWEYCSLLMLFVIYLMACNNGETSFVDHNETDQEIALHWQHVETRLQCNSFALWRCLGSEIQRGWHSLIPNVLNPGCGLHYLYRILCVILQANMLAGHCCWLTNSTSALIAASVAAARGAGSRS